MGHAAERTMAYIFERRYYHLQEHKYGYRNPGLTEIYVFTYLCRSTFYVRFRSQYVFTYLRIYVFTEIYVFRELVSVIV
eukprot:SAG25_NODE_158_length_13455_cov_15.344714_2_plen_79_part_00